MKTVTIKTVALNAVALSALSMVTLVGCAPKQVAAPPVVTAQTVASAVSFYPLQTGLKWSYIPENEVDSEPYVVEAQGPNLFGADQALAFQMTGRGTVQTWYRQISDEAGQRLLGFRKPGINVTLSPALQEYPPINQWHIGATWSGKSRVSVRSDDGKLNQSGTVTYLYKVLDQRQVIVNKQNYTIWALDRQMTDDLGGLFPATQSIWFMPYVGEVRTPESLLLTGRNFGSSNNSGK